jgi:hypothetical protein
MDVNELKFILQDSHIPYTDDEMILLFDLWKKEQGECPKSDPHPKWVSLD